MEKTKIFVKSIVMIGFLLIVPQAFAMDSIHSNVGAGGYDVVAYFTEQSAQRGSGWHVAGHEGTTYLFASKENLNAFKKEPEKYLPQYGGYCAFGVAVGKKFYADPTLWKVVDGKLYFNLDAKIQKKFEKDIPGYITKADSKWPTVQNDNPAGL